MLDHLLSTKKRGSHAALDPLLKENSRILDPLPEENELAKFLKSYLLTCKVEGKSPSTLSIYGNVLRYYIQFAIANKLSLKASKVSADDIRLFLLSCQERKLAPSTVNDYYRALRTFFNWLEREEFIRTNPMRKIRAPKVLKKIMRPFTREDIDNLLLLCSGHRFVDIRNTAIILLFLDTGLRLFELASIQCNDMNFEHETIIVMGKGGKERVVKFGDVTKKALWRYKLRRELKEKENYPCLWLTEEMTPMSKGAIQTVIKRLCKRARITDVRLGPHTLRHTFATWAMLNGARRDEVQVLLGHSTETMTMHYQATVNSMVALQRHKGDSEHHGFGPVDRMGLK